MKALANVYEGFKEHYTAKKYTGHDNSITIIKVIIIMTNLPLLWKIGLFILTGLLGKWVKKQVPMIFAMIEVKKMMKKVKE